MARPDAVEIEVKLGVADPAALRALIDAPDPDPGRLAGFAPAGPAHDVRVLDRYLDTADERLRGSGVRARLRAVDGRVVLAVKDAGHREGDVHARTELEGPATGALDPDAWPASAARERLAIAVAGVPLRVVAALRQDRRTRRLRRGDTEVELSLDTVEALDLAAVRVLASRLELEAELVAGDPDALHELAEALRRVTGVVDAYGAKLRFAREALAETER